MGHCVRAFVGARSILELVQRQYALSRVVDLEQQLALLPLTDELYDAIPGEFSAPSERKFQLLTAKIVSLLRETSTYGVVGYFETNYIDGVGDQGAVLARLGEITFGPQVGPNSINLMLESLGARRKTSDAFDAVGLGRYRNNEAWANVPKAGERAETITLTGNIISWIQNLGKK